MATRDELREDFTARAAECNAENDGRAMLGSDPSGLSPFGFALVLEGLFATKHVRAELYLPGGMSRRVKARWTYDRRDGRCYGGAVVEVEVINAWGRWSVKARTYLRPGFTPRQFVLAAERLVKEEVQ